MRRRRHLTSAATSVVVILAFTILPQPPVLRQRRNLRGALAPFLPPGVPSLLSLRRLPSSLSLSSSARVGLGSRSGRPPHLDLERRRARWARPWAADPRTPKAHFVTDDEVGRRSRIRYTGPIPSFFNRSRPSSRTDSFISFYGRKLFTVSNTEDSGDVHNFLIRSSSSLSLLVQCITVFLASTIRFMHV
jgi:hypothetical protein